jgi:maleylacetate reductase
VIVRWGLDQLIPILSELGIERPLLVASPRWDELKLPAASRWTEVPSDRIAVPDGVDGIRAVGGCSAIDTAKAASAASGLPMVSVPTTYSGSEWAPSFGVRKPDRRAVGGGAGANLAGIVYDPELTLSLPREVTVGTAMNALAHAAEAMYVKGRNDEADRDAREAATRIAASLPAVVADEQAIGPRKTLLAGASRAGAALASAGLGLGHAMAQALGGRYGLAHGTMNAITLPLALRFNAPVATKEIESFGDAMGTDDAIGKVELLAGLGEFGRLRDYRVPEEELGDVAKVVVERPGAKVNPRPASPAEVEGLLRSAW